MNTNKLAALLAVPVMVLSAASVANTETDHTALQLLKLGKGTHALLNSLESEYTTIQRLELEKRFALFSYLINRLNWQENEAISPENQNRILTAVNLLLQPITEEQAKPALSEMLNDKRFYAVTEQLVNTLEEKRGMLKSEEDLLIYEMELQLPESFSKLDKDILTLQRIYVEAAKVCISFADSDLTKSAQSLNVYNDAIEKLLAKLRDYEGEPMSEAAVEKYWYAVFDNSAYVDELNNSLGRLREKLADDASLCPQFVDEYKRFLRLDAEVAELDVQRIIPADVVQFFELWQNLPDEFSWFEQNMLVWARLDLEYARKLSKVATADVSQIAGELKVYNDAYERLLGMMRKSELRRMSAPAMVAYLQILNEKEALITPDGEAANERKSEQAALVGTCPAFAFQQERCAQLVAQLNEIYNPGVIPSAYNLVLDIKNALPASFSEYDKTMLTLQQICLKCAEVARQTAEISHEEAVSRLKVYNAASEFLLPGISGLETESMSADGSWQFVTIMYENAPSFKSLECPSPEQKEKLKAAAETCPAFGIEIERSRQIANELLKKIPAGSGKS